MKLYTVIGLFCILAQQPSNAMQRTRYSYAPLIAVAALASVPAFYYLYRTYNVGAKSGAPQQKQPDTTEFPLSFVRAFPIPRTVTKVTINEEAVPKIGHKVVFVQGQGRCELLCKFRARNADDINKILLSTRNGTTSYEVCPELQVPVDVRVDYELLVPEGHSIKFE